MKKVLFWDDMVLKNTGGPSGYCYNIHEYLKVNPCPQIDFLSDIIRSSECLQHNEIKEYKPLLPETKLKDFFKKTFVYKWMIELSEKIALLHYFLYGIYTKPFDFEIDIELLNSYSFIHVHFLYDVLRIKNSFPNYKGKIILTSHCPCPWIDERISEGKQWMKVFHYWLIKNECKAYEKADYLMFPCVDAREPYEKNIMIEKVFRSMEQKFFYVPSAINDIAIDEVKMQHLSEIGIPEGSFVITYIGRHCEVKGYDILKRIAPRLLDEFESLYFVCAGRGDIEPLYHPRWIELGFIKNAEEIHYLSDLYVLPNRDTYFDLVALEILRSKTVVVMSKTGGNKFFEKMPEDEITGIHFFDIDNEEQLISIVANLIELKKSNPLQYEAMCSNNRNLYLKKFTVRSFIINYIKSINEL